HGGGCGNNGRGGGEGSPPPLAASMTCAPNLRSASRHSSAAASTGKASSISTAVSSTFQQKIGIRNMVMPGARMQMIVVMKLTALRMVPKPESTSPMIHISEPMPGERIASLRGAYANQPNDAAPSGVKKPATTMRPPNR